MPINRNLLNKLRYIHIFMAYYSAIKNEKAFHMKRYLRYTVKWKVQVQEKKLQIYLYLLIYA